MPEAVYTPRRSTETALYRIVREYYGTFLSEVEQTYASGLPKYVTDTFERYLKCGVFAHGFTRCHCDACGHDVLVPFSCKQRGLCPSCGTRRMSNAAAHLTDRVLPNAPLRQWVLSIPYELRLLAAMKPDVLRTVSRVFASEIARTTRQLANRPNAQTGALAFPQRFGGSVNLNVHIHTIALDAVIEKTDEGVSLVETPAPTQENLQCLIERVAKRILKWLVRRKYIQQTDAENKSNEQPEIDAIVGCAQLSLNLGSFLSKPESLQKTEDDDAPFEKKQSRYHATYLGFNVHAGVYVSKGNNIGREKLLRYCTRPSIALERIEILKNGRIAYRMKYARGKRTHRVMTPVEFLARIAALIPPPRYPMIRYYGVFAGNSPLRKCVVPNPPQRKSIEASCKEANRVQRKTQSEMTTNSSILSPSAQVHEDPFVISVSHWGRLHDGALLAISPRIDWATLLKRSFGLDALICPKCHGRLRVLSVIEDTDVSMRILNHLGLETTAPTFARARDPTEALDSLMN